MSIRTACQACGHVFRVKDEFAGVRAKCTRCGAVVQVPQLSADAPKQPIAASPPPKQTAPPPPRPSATAPPSPAAATGSAPLIHVSDDASSAPSRAASHTRHGRRTAGNPNTPLLIVAGVLAVALLGVIGAGALYLAGGVGGERDVAEDNRDDAWQVNPDDIVRPEYLDADASRRDARPGSRVQRISSDGFQTTTSSGDVEVEIASARLGRLPNPDRMEPDKQYLHVTLELRNKGGEQLRYSAWDGQALLTLPVVLTDSSGRRYRQKVLPKFNTDGDWGAPTAHFDSNVHPVYVGESEFDAQVLGADEPVLVDFYADWCPPCRALAPTIDRLAQATAGKAKIVKVDVDKNKGLARRYGIRGIPHLIVFHNGEIVAQNPGRSFDSLLAAIDRVAPGVAEPAPTGEALEPHSTIEQTLFFEPGDEPAEFLRLELPADAIGGQGVLTLEIPWTMIVASTAIGDAPIRRG